MDYKKTAFFSALNYPGYKVNKRIVVFESDDWGSVRIPSKDIYNKLLAKGIEVDNCPYSKYDCLESESDYYNLFETLSKHKDHSGNYPIFTLNFLSANPDFEKIRLNNFKEYYFESFTKTYTRQKSNAFRALQIGLDNRLIHPQSHGREHLNVAMWLNLLKSNKDIRTAFDHDCFALSFKNSKSINLPYLQAFKPYGINYFDEHKNIVNTGLKLFFDTFKFNSETFIAPGYVRYNSLEEYLSQKGVIGIQGLYFQMNSVINGKEKKSFRIFKLRNQYNQIQLVRNCFFEPSTNERINWVDECLSQIGIAFKYRKPAIISTHRLNYIGGLDLSNRSKNLTLLSNLIKGILLKWPDVEFQNNSTVVKNLIN